MGLTNPIFIPKTGKESSQHSKVAVTAGEQLGKTAEQCATIVRDGSYEELASISTGCTIHSANKQLVSRYRGIHLVLEVLQCEILAASWLEAGGLWMRVWFDRCHGETRGLDDVRDYNIPRAEKIID